MNVAGMAAIASRAMPEDEFSLYAASASRVLPIRRASLAALFHKVPGENTNVVLGRLEVMWGKRHRQDGDTRIQGDAHEAVHNGLRNEVVPVDASVHDERRRSDSGVPARFRKIARNQGKLESAWHIENVDLMCRDQLQEAVQGLADDLSMPVGLHECIAGVCHGDLLSGNRHVTQGDHVRADPAILAGRLARSLSSGL